MTEAVNGDRLFATTYNEPTQASLANENTNSDVVNDWVLDYLGRIRLDAMLFRRIVMPIAYIWDGAFFLEMDPAVLLRSTSRTPGVLGSTLEIRANRATFDESLLDSFRRDDHLHGFVFDSINDPQQRAFIAKKLRQTKNDVLDRYLLRSEYPSQAILSLIKEILHAEGVEASPELARIERGWSNWRSFLGRQITLKPYARSDHFADGIAGGYIDTSQIGGYGSGVLAEFLQLAAARERPFRSDMSILFQRAAAQADNAADRRDVTRIKRFAFTGYNRAAALDYSCTFGYVPSEDDPASPRVENHLSSLDDAAEVLPPGLLKDLATLPDERFYIFNAKAHDDLQEWWAHRDESALKRGIERLARELEQTGASSQSDTKVAEILLTIPGVGLATAASLAVDLVPGIDSPWTGAVGSAVGALGVLAGLYATRHFRSQPRRKVEARLLEYCDLTTSR